MFYYATTTHPMTLPSFRKAQSSGEENPFFTLGLAVSLSVSALPIEWASSLSRRLEGNLFFSKNSFFLEERQATRTHERSEPTTFSL